MTGGMTKGVAGSMRHRVTLLDQNFTQGAGGRMTPTLPIIADVWASISECGAATVQHADHQFLGRSVVFETWFQSEYAATKIIEFGSLRYKVQSFRKKGLVTLTIEFQTVIS